MKPAPIAPLLALLFIALCLAPPSRAQSALSDEGRALVERLVLDRAAVLMTLQRRHEEAEGQIIVRLASRDRDVRRALGAAAEASAEERRLSIRLSFAQRSRRLHTTQVRQRIVEIPLFAGSIVLRELEARENR